MCRYTCHGAICQGGSLTGEGTEGPGPGERSVTSRPTPFTVGGEDVGVAAAVAARPRPGPLPPLRPPLLPSPPLILLGT